MPPQALSLALFLIEEGIKEEPAIAKEIQDFFGKADPTPQEWMDLRSRVNQKTYANYVPKTRLVSPQADKGPVL